MAEERVAMARSLTGWGTLSREMRARPWREKNWRPVLRMSSSESSGLSRVCPRIMMDVVIRMAVWNRRYSWRGSASVVIRRLLLVRACLMTNSSPFSR